MTSTIVHERSPKCNAHIASVRVFVVIHFLLAASHLAFFATLKAASPPQPPSTKPASRD